MATLGQPLYSPEPGWRRINLSNYKDFFITNTHTTNLTELTYERISKFNFTGTSIRIINGSISSTSYPLITSIKVMIDGAIVFDQAINTDRTFFYETTALENTEHYVQIITTAPLYNNWTQNTCFRIGLGFVDILSSKYTILYNEHLIGRCKMSMLDIKKPGDYIWALAMAAPVSSIPGTQQLVIDTIGGVTEEEVSASKKCLTLDYYLSTDSRYFKFIFIGYTPTGKRKFISNTLFSIDSTNLSLFGFLGPEAALTSISSNRCYKIRRPALNEIISILRSCTLASTIPEGTFTKHISLIPSTIPSNILYDGSYTQAPTHITTHCIDNNEGSYSVVSLRTLAYYGASGDTRSYLILEVDKDFIDFSNMKVSPTHVHTSNAPVEIRSIVPFHPLSTEHDRLVKFGVTINGVPYISPPAEFVPWNITHTLDMSIPYAYLAYGENTVEFSAVSKSKNSGKFSFKIYKEGEYRTIANRTFTSIDGGYITNNIKMGDVGAVEDLSRRGYITTTSKTNVNVARYGSIVKVTANSTGGKFLVSFDDRQNWYSFRNNAWVRVLPTNIDGFGMTAAQMGAVTTSDWQTIFKQTALDIMVQLELNETITGISVQLPNNVGPTIQSFDASPRSICQESVTVTAVVEDPENDALSYRLSINDGVYKNWSPSMPSPTVINEMLPFDIFTIGTDATTIKFEVRDIAGTVATRTARISRVEKPASEIVDYGADVQQAILNSDATIEDIYSAATHRYVALACLDGPMLPFKTE